MRCTRTGIPATAFALLLALLPSASADDRERPAPQAPPTPDRINASPTGEPGHYHVTPVFDEVARVEVVLRGGPYGRAHRRLLDPETEYAFDADTGALHVTAAVDDAREMVVVRGRRARPWAWRVREPLAEVRILLDDREAVRGEDFAVDPGEGLIVLLKPSLCTPDRHYYVSYRLAGEQARGGAIGNHPDRAAVRRFLGLEDEPRPDRPAGAVGTNASRTDDARVWTLVRSMDPDTIRVAILPRDEPGRPAWLTRGPDYLYDAKLARIVLRPGLAVDTRTHLLFVHGVPGPRHVFHRHRPLAEGTVQVVVDGRALDEGTGFTVDHATGTITVHDEAIRRHGTRFRISTPDWGFGN